MSLLKLVLCQHKNLPPSFLLAAQTAALGNYDQGTGLWFSREGGTGMSHSGLEEALPGQPGTELPRLAHGNLAGLRSTALPSHWHRNPGAAIQTHCGGRGAEQSVQEHHGLPPRLSHAHCAPCANSSLLANLIKR